MYFSILGSILLIKWMILRKENRYIQEKWENLSSNEKTLVRLYTDFGVIVGYLYNIFNDTWLSIQDISSGSILNIEWRSIKGFEVIPKENDGH